MKRLSTWVSLGVGLALAGAVASTLFVGGCTSHGEGGRCDPRNVDPTTNAFADCDSNLTCKSGLLLELPDGGGNPQGYICCPVAPNLPTTDICRASPPSPGSDASIPDGGFDTGTNDASNDQATSDVAVDAPSDSSATDSGDAAADATGD